MLLCILEETLRSRKKKRIILRPNIGNLSPVNIPKAERNDPSASPNSNSRRNSFVISGSLRNSQEIPSSICTKKESESLVDEHVELKNEERVDPARKDEPKTNRISSLFKRCFGCASKDTSYSEDECIDRDTERDTERDRSERRAGEVYIENGRTVLAMKGDGLCFFRAVMCKETNKNEYATCSSQELQDTFFSCFKENFISAILKTDAILLQIYSGDSLRHLRFALMQMKDNLRYVFNLDRLDDLLRIEFPGRPKYDEDDTDSDISALSDLLFFELKNIFDPEEKLKLKYQHYDLYLD